MIVTFIYTALSGGSSSTIKLALGTRLAPTDHHFNYTGVAQPVHYPRAEKKTFFARGGASVTESFTCLKEHSEYWNAVIWTRKTMAPIIGKRGDLKFEGDNGGQIILIDCICTVAGGRIVGGTSLVDFEFVGGIWQ